MNTTQHNTKASAAADKPAQLGGRELATILAALRLWQADPFCDLPEDQAQAIREIASDGGKFEPLNPAEIGALCERLNAPAPAPLRVQDIHEDFILVTDSQDIRATLESIGQAAALAWVGCLFVQVLDGDYGTVYACENSIPYLAEPVICLQ